jgi:membrane-bound lytic murein transglycosylase MltF
MFNPFVPKDSKMIKRLMITITMLAVSLPVFQSASAEEFSMVAERATRSYQDMLDVRLIRVLVVSSKTFYFIDGAQQRGVSYDLLKRFEDQINENLESGHLKVYVGFIPVARDHLIPALLEGRGDIAVANLTITPERQELVGFSMPMFKNVRELVVTDADATPMSSIDELSGMSVHVRQSSSYYSSLLQVNMKLQERGLPPIDIVLASEFLEDEDLLEMVNAQLIPAIIVDSHKAHFWDEIFDNIRIHEELAVRVGGNIAWAFRKNSPEFAKVVNGFVKENRKGSLMGNILFKRYLQNTQYVRNVLEPGEMEKFQATADLFKEYAGQYDFDWLMLIAQGYQESRLDQSTRSSAGAVGVMQLLPSTAADKNVGIEDISSTEDNIHAGAKYMWWLRNTYFNDPDMSDEEQTLFSFAAYNAGPGRVIRLRKEAGEIGLNPNIWFDNVEVVAAKRIGRETLQYVSNIYKYWVAYKLALNISENKQKAKSG